MKPHAAYSLLRQDPEPGYWKVLAVHGLGPDTLRSGAPLQPKLKEPMRVTIGSWGTAPRDFFELPCPIVSDAMRRTLQGVGIDNIEYIAARLEMEFYDSPVEGYWVCNVIGSLSCLAPDASFEPGARPEGDLRSFQVDPALSYGLSLFNIAEDPRLVAVSQRVRTALEAAPLRGVFFQETVDYDGYPVGLPAQPDV